ncbi:MAG: DUF3021 family protein [Oscillospiraceae bacterium]
MKKAKVYFYTDLLSFAALTLLWSTVDVLFPDYFLRKLNSALVLQFFAVTTAIALLHWGAGWLLCKTLSSDKWEPLYIPVQLGCIALVVFFLGGLGFGWFPFTFSSIASVLALIAVIYGIVLYVTLERQKKIAGRINQILTQKNKKRDAAIEDESHRN